MKGCGTHRRCALAGRRRSLQAGVFRLFPVFVLACSFSQSIACEQASGKHSYCHEPHLPHPLSPGQSHSLSPCGTETSLKPWASMNPSFSGFCQVFVRETTNELLQPGSMLRRHRREHHEFEVGKALENDPVSKTPNERRAW